MKFFALFFLGATLLCAGFWIHDPAGSGMGWPTAGFALLGGGTLVYNRVRNGGWLVDTSASLNERTPKP